MRRLGNKHQTIDEFLKDDCGSLPEDHPHIRLYWDVAPIWRGPLKDFYAEVVAETFDCGFASGYESGLVTAVLLPEWAVIGAYASITSRMATRRKTSKTGSATPRRRRQRCQSRCMTRVERGQTDGPRASRIATGGTASPKGTRSKTAAKLRAMLDGFPQVVGRLF